MNRLQASVKANKGEPLLGIAVYFYDPPFLDMAAHLGFKVMWIEMEHSFMGFSEVADLCRMAKSAGMLTMIRTANANRENVMKAAECGPDIIDVPMVETVEHVNALIDSARFAPEGNRGFFSVSPSLAYSLKQDVVSAQKQVNEDLCLMVQVETAAAVDNIDALCAVPGVEIFIGPSDLSASLGVPGELSHPKVLEAARKVVAAAKKAGKLVAVGSGPAEFEFYAQLGVDVLFCGNDFSCMKIGIQAMLQQGQSAVAKAAQSAAQGVKIKMEFRTLKQTDLKVSRLCFGTMTFAKPVEQAEANTMIDTCLDAGINFIDTANMYQVGAAEEMLGHAMRGKRDRIVLATKVRAKMGEGAEQSGLSRKAILNEVENSLRRLQTDYFDLYFLHQPDYDVPIDETLEAMQLLVQQGKVRFPGTSNYAAWQVGQILDIARHKKYVPAATAQPMYNLLARGIEQEFIPMAKAFDVSIVAYNPLAAGLLTGKHAQGAIPAGGRFDNNAMYQERYWHAQTFEAVKALQDLASEAGRSLISLAFAWLLHHTVTDCVILGASRLEQLKQNIASCAEGPLAPEIVSGCDRVWAQLRGPLPVYNR